MKQYIRSALSPDSLAISQIVLPAGTYSIRVTITVTLDAGGEVSVKDDLSGLSVGRETFIPLDGQEHIVLTPGGLLRTHFMSLTGILDAEIYISRIG